MTTKKLLSIAIIAALPTVAMAENISGAMYIAPSGADNNHPAPITYHLAPYGRIDIDTADQEHIATTAYVKGAYNSAIAGINKVKSYTDSNKQTKLFTEDNDEDDDPSEDIGEEVLTSGSLLWSLENRDTEDIGFESSLVTAMAVAKGILSQHVTIYTTWDDDRSSATTVVPLTTVVPED